MKIFYRLLILILIAAGVFLQLSTVGLQGHPAEAILRRHPTPLRAGIPEHPGGYARELLSERRQLLYDAIVDAAEGGRADVFIPLTGLSNYDIESVTASITNDLPELFWVDFSSVSYTFGRDGLSLSLTLTAAGDELRAMRDALNSAVEDTAALADGLRLPNEYEKAVFLHDYIASNCRYGQQDNAHNAYGALVEGTAVCDGYTQAFSLLLRKLGINSFFIVGSVEGRDGTEGHSWNLVEMDGVVSHIDLTWDDLGDETFASSGYSVGGDVVSHAYFGLSDTEIAETHAPSPASFYPPPPATSNGWPEYNGLAGETVESVAGRAAETLIANMSKSVPYVELRLAGREEYGNFVNNVGGASSLIIEKANERLAELGEERVFSATLVVATSDTSGCALLLCQLNEAAEPEGE